MLPQGNRIKKKKDFDAIFKNSKSFKNNLFVFKIAKNNLGKNRFGFIVSSKISKKATVRNKVKRMLVEIMRLEAKNIKPETDLVIIALSGIEKKDFSEIKKSLGFALAKAKLTIRN